jgi:hypothetical protein
MAKSRPTQQRGRHGCRWLHLVGRQGAFHPVEQTSFDVVPHEGIQAEFPAEVMVKGSIMLSRNPVTTLFCSRKKVQL